MAVKGLNKLSFLGHNAKKYSNDPLKNVSTGGTSKQHIVEHKMFGSKRKNIQIGKKFKGSKSVMHGTHTPKMMGHSGISPSLAEFDKMMSGIAGKGSKGSGSKKGLFGKKHFE